MYAHLWKQYDAVHSRCSENLARLKTNVQRSILESYKLVEKIFSSLINMTMYACIFACLLYNNIESDTKFIMELKAEEENCFI